MVLSPKFINQRRRYIKYFHFVQPNMMWLGHKLQDFHYWAGLQNYQTVHYYFGCYNHNLVVDTEDFGYFIGLIIDCLYRFGCCCCLLSCFLQYLWSYKNFVEERNYFVKKNCYWSLRCCCWQEFYYYCFDQSCCQLCLFGLKLSSMKNYWYFVWMKNLLNCFFGQNLGWALDQDQEWELEQELELGKEQVQELELVLAVEEVEEVVEVEEEGSMLDNL